MSLTIQALREQLRPLVDAFTSELVVLLVGHLGEARDRALVVALDHLRGELEAGIGQAVVAAAEESGSGSRPSPRRKCGKCKKTGHTARTCGRVPADRAAPSSFPPPDDDVEPRSDPPPAGRPGPESLPPQGPNHEPPPPIEAGPLRANRGLGQSAAGRTPAMTTAAAMATRSLWWSN